MVYRHHLSGQNLEFHLVRILKELHNIGRNKRQITGIIVPKKVFETDMKDPADFFHTPELQFRLSFLNPLKSDRSTLQKIGELLLGIPVPFSEIPDFLPQIDEYDFLSWIAYVLHSYTL